MANYSNTLVRLIGKKEHIKSFEDFCLNDQKENFKEDILSNIPENFFIAKKLSKTKKDEKGKGIDVYYFSAIFRRYTCIDEIIHIATKNNLEFQMADCYEGFDTTIFFSKNAETISYKHNIETYLEHPEYILIGKKLNILSDVDLIIGCGENKLDELIKVHPTVLDAMKKKNFLKDLNTAVELYQSDLGQDPFNGDVLVGTKLENIHHIKEKIISWHQHLEMKKIIKNDNKKSIIKL